MQKCKVLEEIKIKKNGCFISLKIITEHHFKADWTILLKWTHHAKYPFFDV